MASKRKTQKTEMNLSQHKAIEWTFTDADKSSSLENLFLSWCLIGLGSPGVKSNGQYSAYTVICMSLLWRLNYVTLADKVYHTGWSHSLILVPTIMDDVFL